MIICIVYTLYGFRVSFSTISVDPLRIEYNIITGAIKSSTVV